MARKLHHSLTRENLEVRLLVQLGPGRLLGVELVAQRLEPLVEAGVQEGVVHEKGLVHLLGQRRLGEGKLF